MVFFCKCQIKLTIINKNLPLTIEPLLRPDIGGRGPCAGAGVAELRQAVRVVHRLPALAPARLLRLLHAHHVLQLLLLARFRLGGLRAGWGRGRVLILIKEWSSLMDGKYFICNNSFPYLIYLPLVHNCLFYM